MADEKNLEQRVIEIIAGEIEKPVEEITLDKSFEGDLGADSLERIELVMAFEDAFELTIPEEDAEKILTVGDAITAIRQLTARPQPDE